MRAPESPEVKLAVVALNLWFVGQVIASLFPAVTSAGPGEWMTSLAALVMVFAGTTRTAALWNDFPQGLRMLVGLGLLILIPMTVRGVFQGMDDPLYTALQALPWYAAIFLPALGYPRLPDSLLACFRWHAFLGVAATAGMVAMNWEIVSASSIRREETLEIKIIQFLLYSLFFQIFRMSSEPIFHRLVALSGLSLMTIIALASATRQAIVLIAIVILMSVFANGRNVHGVAASGLRTLSVLVTAVLFLGASIAYILANLQGATELFGKRMTSEREGTSLRNNSRLQEVQILIDQFGPADYVFGRGIRGEFDNTVAPKQDNVHIGWFRTLLKGGVPLVMLFLIGYVLTALRVAIRPRDGVVLAAAFMVLYFGIKSITGNIILANGHFYIVAICVGTLYAADADRRPHNFR